ncbi:MAG: hypothetical protein ICV64_05875 [Thermoleophilia bacterium]|nr:hypothetical protein [Thermoleophilia bacterium]
MLEGVALAAGAAARLFGRPAVGGVSPVGPLARLSLVPARATLAALQLAVGLALAVGAAALLLTSSRAD